LQSGKLTSRDVDVVAHGFSYEAHLFGTDAYSLRQFKEVFSPDVQKQLLRGHFPETDWDRKFCPVPHHLAHAASAFYLSGFEEALVLISDGMGEMESMTVLLGNLLGMKVLSRVQAFHSLGTLYGVFTLYLG